MSNITLGIIGSGQLGSLLCQAAKKLNVKTVVISDDEQGPAQNYTDQFIFTKYENKEKVKEFINKVDVVTYEFENIPIEILKDINKERKVLPKPDINQIVQNSLVRIRNCDTQYETWTDRPFFFSRIVQ